MGVGVGEKSFGGKLKMSIWQHLVFFLQKSRENDMQGGILFED